jgi:hypothetical protein
MYHGSALIQVAEHPQFTAINSLKLGGVAVPVAYKINDEIALYLKYASVPTSTFKEYVFTFNKEHLDEIKRIKTTNQKMFVALVCVKVREICCLSYEQLLSMITSRQNKKGAPEDQYAILVTAPKGKGLRVYVNNPGTKKKILGDPLIVARNTFPEILFL